MVVGRWGHSEVGVDSSAQRAVKHGELRPEVGGRGSNLQWSLNSDCISSWRLEADGSSWMGVDIQMIRVGVAFEFIRTSDVRLGGMMLHFREELIFRWNRVSELGGGFGMSGWSLNSDECNVRGSVG